MTLQLKPGHDLSDEELYELEALLKRQYPDEDIVIVVEDAPAGHADRPAPDQPAPTIFTRLIVAGITAIAVLYLVNPGSGLVELIPDFVPVIGNMDEAAAVALVISGLSFFGVNIGWLSSIFGPGIRKRKRGD